METVAFYSYKGGVGRSLLLANTARFLALSGQRVVALDLDFEAPGLHYKFDIERRVQTGVVELLLRGLKGEAPETIHNACVEVTLPVSQGGALLVLSAGPAPNIEYWESLSELQELLTSRLGDGLLEALLDLQMRIEEELAPDVLLVDTRTGVTELGGFATTALSDRVVLVTSMNAESIDGIHAIAGALRRTPVLGDKPERKIHFVAARVHGTEPVDKSLWGESFEECFELPNDPIDGATERHMGSGIQMGRDWDERHRYRSDLLLVATFKWIQRAFPVNAKAAELSRRRLLAVDDAWRMLTQTSRRVGLWSTGRDAWDPKSLATSVQVKASDGSSRIADIVAHLGAEKDKAAMVIEYVDDQPHEQVARWWFDNTRAAVVALLSGEEGVRAIFSGRDRDGSHRLRPSKRRDLPTPDDFKVLDDPADFCFQPAKSSE